MNRSHIIRCFSCLLLCLASVATMGACKASGLDGPPDALIVYSSDKGAANKYHIYLATWPDPKPRQLEPKAIGEYGLGDFLYVSSFSPDGSKVVVVGNRRLPNGKQVETDGVKGTDLWVLDIKANTIKPITTDGASYHFTQWSPDGRYVSAISHEGYWPTPPIDDIGEWKLNLYVWEVATGRRTFLASSVNGSTWSRDGKYLYYDGQTDRFGPPTILRISRSGGKPVVGLEEAQWVGWVSPNGKYLSFGGFQLGIKTLGSKEVRYFLSQTSPVTRFDHLWAPDSRQIAVADVTYDGYPQKARLMILDTTTRETRILDDKHNQGSIIAWSHDGKWIIVTRSSGDGEASKTTLDAVSANGQQAVTLLPSLESNGLDWHELPSK